MNAKIKALLEQSKEESKWLIGTSSPVYEVNQQKFAQLIIKECFDCIDIMENIANSTNASIPSDYDKHTYLKTLDALRGLVEIHFGVE